MLYLGRCPTVVELKKEARDLKIRGSSKMNKENLKIKIAEKYVEKEQKNIDKTYRPFIESDNYEPFSGEANKKIKNKLKLKIK